MATAGLPRQAPIVPSQLSAEHVDHFCILVAPAEPSTVLQIVVCLQNLLNIIQVNIQPNEDEVVAMDHSHQVPAFLCTKATRHDINLLKPALLRHRRVMLLPGLRSWTGNRRAKRATCRAGPQPQAGVGRRRPGHICGSSGPS